MNNVKCEIAKTNNVHKSLLSFRAIKMKGILHWDDRIQKFDREWFELGNEEFWLSKLCLNIE